MSNALILKEFKNSTLVNGAGGLSVSAGRFSRGAIIAAFELNGGLEAFATWAKENQTDFYTRMFGRVIGKEALEAPKGPDDVEDLLDAIEDVEFEDITDKVEAWETKGDGLIAPEMKVILAELATAYSRNENE